MFRKNKNKLAMLGFLLVMVMTGCQQNTDAKVHVSTLVLEKNGGISAITVGDFSQPYYQEDGLKTLAEEEIQDYNEENDSDLIKLKSVQVVETVATIEVHYKDAKVYESFNDQILFTGTIEEAIAAGYSMDVSLLDTSKEGQTIGKAELEGMKSKHILISDEKEVNIRLPKKVKYYSVDAQLVGTKEVHTYGGEDMTYLIYE